jgi:ribosomal protein L9
MPYIESDVVTSEILLKTTKLLEKQLRIQLSTNTASELDLILFNLETQKQREWEINAETLVEILDEKGMFFYEKAGVITSLFLSVCRYDMIGDIGALDEKHITRPFCSN